MSILGSPYALVSELNAVKEEIEDLHAEIKDLRNQINELNDIVKSQALNQPQLPLCDYRDLSNMMHKVNYEFYNL